MDKVIVTIGGKEYELAPLNLKTLKEIFPLVLEAQTNMGNMDGQAVIKTFDAITKITSAALRKTHPDMTPEKIEEELTTTELMPLRDSFISLMTASGLVQSGEAQPAASQESPSMEISTPSSAS